jgi:membrane-associated phospholipid phosphatase
LKQKKRQPGFFRNIIRVISPTELVTFVFIVLVLILTIIFQYLLDAAGIVIYTTILLLSIIIVNYIRSHSNSKIVRALHTFYIIPLVILVFKTVEKLSFALHGRDYDNVLIAIDRSIFGVNPTVWLYEHFPKIPLLTEIMQLCYFSYYIIPVILATEFFIRRRQVKAGDYYRDELETLRFILIYGLLTSYAVYIMLPGIGPRFTLHDFWSISKELPGVLLTEPIRWFINLAENIRVGMTSIQAAQAVTRDVFPSGHTEITLLGIILAFRLKARSRWLVLFLGTGLIFSTIYLRYHYVIDVIAGALLAIITLYTSAPVMNFFLRMKGEMAKRFAQ